MQTRPQSFIGDNANSRFVLLTDQVYPRVQVTYGGNDDFRDALVVDVESFIGVKSYKAKGKRLTTCTVERIEELEPTRFLDPETETTTDAEETTNSEEANNDDENSEPSLFDNVE